jgi:hypothetical protein
MKALLPSMAVVSLLVAPVAAAPDDGLLPKIDFPAVDTSAKPGDWVLSVNKLMYDQFAADPEKKNVIFYAYELTEAGPKTSKFKTPSSVDSAPNSLVIPIKKAGKAKVGDILLSWWQSGSGMQRAIVVAAKDPKQPTVRYLDLDYDNPAKGGADKNTPIGQMEEQLKADSFNVLGKPFDPGSTVACKDGGEHRVARVVRVAGDKVLVTGFASHLAVRAKADCTALPYAPKVKVGDKVKAYWVGMMKDATVTKVDAKIVRIWVKYDKMGDKATAVAYGHVIAKL